MVQLNHITVENFRSIRGKIEIPLDAPIVLVHGHNGAGKTSLLSAIELSLTGQIPSLSRVDRNYLQHLTNKSEESSKIQISTIDKGDQKSSQILVSDNEIKGTPLLSKAGSRFFSERCYLAQSTLSRLLEIYESKDSGSSSPLTRFVKDLLGLDNLDSIIDGLHDAGDKRRLKKAVPIYEETLDLIDRLKLKIDELESNSKELDSIASSDKKNLMQKLADAGEISDEPESLETIKNRIKNLGNKDELNNIAFLRREANALLQQWNKIDIHSVEVEKSLKTEEKSILSRLDNWNRSYRSKIENIFNRSSEYLDSPPLLNDKSYSTQAANLLAIVEKEIVYIKKQIERSESDKNTINEINKLKDTSTKKLHEIDQGIISISSDSGRLAQLLSEISHYSSSEECPVCNRDFSEKGAHITLQGHISRRIEELTNKATNLNQLHKARKEKQEEIGNAERRLSEIESRAIEPESLKRIKERKTALSEIRVEMTKLSEVTAVGDSLISEHRSILKKISDIQASNSRSETIRQGVSELLTNNGFSDLPTDEPAGSALARLQKFCDENEQKLSLTERNKERILSLLEGILSIEDRKREMSNLINEYKAKQKTLETKISNADSIVKSSRTLSKKAVQVRSDIVRRVFNESLNSIWKDLFVRLAPDEPFVPAFSIPSPNASRVEAKLETKSRFGGKGGNPRTMLSSGNLNTAALTLFLGLHLSAPPQLPWLVIDDPVQSMDEVHISQFAALLRTLSKFHDRQTVIAVHEKALFDYLKLELSPAYEDDKLITVELEKSPDGFTTASCKTIKWQRDSAFAA